MTFKLVDRVRESCISPGTATVVLAGAALGYQTFSAGVGANNTTYYVIADQSGANWEVGYGTVGAAGTTLARTTVLSSSNAGSLVNFTSGTQDVWVDYPATKAVFQDINGLVTVPTFATSSTTSTTPVLSFNASNTSFASGATVSGSYLQFLLQNKSGTAGASTNYVLSNDLGTDSTYYGEFGMNSSIFSATTPADFFSINNGIYFSGHDGDITFGSGNGFKSYFAWGSSGQSAHVINASGALGFSTNLGTTPALSGTTGYGTAGQVPVSAGSAGAVAWSSTPTLTGTNFTGIPISTGISGLGTGIATWLTTPSSANLLAAMTDETGTGSLVFATSPTLVTPLLGTPTSGILTNCTGYTYANLSGTVPTWNQNTTGTAAGLSATLVATSGGTGQSTYAIGDLLQGGATNTLTKLAAVATGNALISGGVTTASSWGKIGLTTHISGILAGANGGTGVANTGLTFTMAGNVSHAGAFTQTFTATANTSLTLPVSGTVLSSVTAPATNPISGTPSASTYLRGDGTWATFTTGTVTSVAQSFTGGLISVSGSPITSSGTLALTVAGTSGGIPYFSSATTWATSAVLAANALMIGGGAAVAPSTITTGTGVITALGVAVGSAGAFVTNGDALGTPSSGTLTNCTFPTLNQNTTGSSGSCTGNAATATTATTANALNTANAYTVAGITSTAGFTATSAAPFILTATTVSVNYTSPANYNLMSAGPITINTGVTVTIDTTGTWVIV